MIKINQRAFSSDHFHCIARGYERPTGRVVPLAFPKNKKSACEGRDAVYIVQKRTERTDEQRNDVIKNGKENRNTRDLAAAATAAAVGGGDPSGSDKTSFFYRSE